MFSLFFMIIQICKQLSIRMRLTLKDIQYLFLNKHIRLSSSHFNTSEDERRFLRLLWHGMSRCPFWPHKNIQSFLVIVICLQIFTWRMKYETGLNNENRMYTFFPCLLLFYIQLLFLLFTYILHLICCFTISYNNVSMHLMFRNHVLTICILSFTT